jgi:hypothetical protein
MFEYKLLRKANRMRLTVARLKCDGLFLWDCMKSKMYQTGKLEMRQQLLGCINEAAATIRNEMEIHQNIRCSIE